MRTAIMLVFILYFVIFFRRNNIVAVPIFRKLVYSARSNMKMAPWVYFVLVFASSGERAARPEDAFACVPTGPGSQFEVGRPTFCDELPSLLQSPAMGLWQNIYFVFGYVWDVGLSLIVS